MYNIRRKLLSQNFLYNRKLVEQLVERSSLGKQDLVVEIGPGKGIITHSLVKKAGHVVAVELDTYWYRHMQQAYANIDNLTLYHADILSHPLPRLPYKVFANIPFAIEGKVIRKLLDDQNPPQDCYLVVMSELAHRLTLQRESMFSAMYRPWFEFSIVHQFNPTDFTPTPNVHAVLFRFVKKASPLLSFEQRLRYQKFIQKAFGNGRSIRSNLKSSYSTFSLDSALQYVSISKKTKPSQLNLKQWIALYSRINKTEECNP